MYNLIGGVYELTLTRVSLESRNKSALGRYYGKLFLPKKKPFIGNYDCNLF